jgi:hypothetical protein
MAWKLSVREGREIRSCEFSGYVVIFGGLVRASVLVYSVLYWHSVKNASMTYGVNFSWVPRISALVWNTSCKQCWPAWGLPSCATAFQTRCKQPPHPSWILHHCDVLLTIWHQKVYSLLTSWLCADCLLKGTVLGDFLTNSSPGPWFKGIILPA